MTLTPGQIDERYREKYKITWTTPTKSIGDYFRNSTGCQMCNGFIFYPEYGEPRCSNVHCDWNLYKRNRINWEDVNR